jgi:hypothetical protein
MPVLAPNKPLPSTTKPNAVLAEKYRICYNLCFEKLSPDVKKRVIAARTHPEVQDRMVSDFCQRVIEMAQLEPPTKNSY